MITVLKLIIYKYVGEQNLKKLYKIKTCYSVRKHVKKPFFSIQFTLLLSYTLKNLCLSHDKSYKLNILNIIRTYLVSGN